VQPAEVEARLGLLGGALRLLGDADGVDPEALGLVPLLAVGGDVSEEVQEQALHVAVALGPSALEPDLEHLARVLELSEVAPEVAEVARDLHDAPGLLEGLRQPQRLAVGVEGGDPVAALVKDHPEVLERAQDARLVPGLLAELERVAVVPERRVEVALAVRDQPEAGHDRRLLDAIPALAGRR